MDSAENADCRRAPGLLPAELPPACLCCSPGWLCCPASCLPCSAGACLEGGKPCCAASLRCASLARRAASAAIAASAAASSALTGAVHILPAAGATPGPASCVAALEKGDCLTPLRAAAVAAVAGLSAAKGLGWRALLLPAAGACSHASRHEEHCWAYFIKQYLTEACQHFKLLRPVPLKTLERAADSNMTGVQCHVNMQQSYSEQQQRSWGQLQGLHLYRPGSPFLVC